MPTQGLLIGTGIDDGFVVDAVFPTTFLLSITIRTFHGTDSTSDRVGSALEWNSQELPIRCCSKCFSFSRARRWPERWSEAVAEGGSGSGVKQYS